MASLNAGEIAKLIKETRNRHGLTQAELAEACGLTDETVSRVERGAVEPSLSTVAAIAEAFDMTIDELVGRAARREAERTNVLLRRLQLIAARLDDRAQRALIQIAELLPREKQP